MAAGAALRPGIRHGTAAAAGPGFLMGASRLGARASIRREPAAAASDRQVGVTVAAVIAGLATVSWCLWVVLAFFAA